jgi:error-prone DNA polymerase
VRDAIRHGVDVLGPDVAASRKDCTLEPRTPAAGPVGFPQPGWHADPSTCALRIGLRYVRGLSDSLLDRIDEERAREPFAGLEDFVRRTAATVDAIEALATAGAFEACFGKGRRDALWAAGAVRDAAPQRHGGAVVERLPGVVVGADAPSLPGMTDVEEASADLWALGMSPARHPTEFVRPMLDASGALTVAALREQRHGTIVEVGGIVTHRQQPSTAKGTVFLNLEDETGLVNVICTPGAWKRFRAVARTQPALRVRGVLERHQGVINLVARRITPLPLSLADALRSRDFR